MEKSAIYFITNIHWHDEKPLKVQQELKRLVIVDAAAVNQSCVLSKYVEFLARALKPPATPPAMIVLNGNANSTNDYAE